MVIKQNTRLAPSVHVALGIETVCVVVAWRLVTEVANPGVVANHLAELDVSLLDQRRRADERRSDRVDEK